MFGSLVLVFPTKHEGGALILRDDHKEWTYDSAKVLRDHDDPCIGYVAFYSDVEHEVAVVNSGYRITLTYNLYRVLPSESGPSTTIFPTGNLELKRRLETLLVDPSFLPDGGLIGFGLHHQYPLSRHHYYGQDKRSELVNLKNLLKGSDAQIMAVVRQLSLNATIQLWYKNDSYGDGYDDYCLYQGILCDFIPTVRPLPEDESFGWLALEEGGKRVGNIQEAEEARAENCERHKDDRYFYPPRGKVPIDMEVSWVTELNDLAVHEIDYAAYGNSPSLETAYCKFCLIVKVGAYGQRKTE